ncbi:membrane protein RL11I [Cercopithecine betaherpesvirus 5]|uniref:Membrane protein RL11I n=1 Tax=Simian cytomegalovirus (strain Colburn) TaxID=50292 RepID=G8XTR0_SCMVC|nr:membrane protein RL11I [Cercopithecine betaherpesvirus 5]
MTLHPAQRLWIACYVSWILVVIPITHGSTTTSINTTAGTQLTTNNASTPAITTTTNGGTPATTTIQTTKNTGGYANTTIEATANYTTIETNGTTAATATTSVQTTLPPWPVEINHPYKMWTNNCYCGALTVPVGANLTLNGTQNRNNTLSAWLYPNALSDLLCAFWPDTTNYSMEQKYVNYNCTREQLMLLNLSTDNTGIYYNLKDPVSEHGNRTFICYNVTVSANTTNTTNIPLIKTTRCGPPPWQLPGFKFKTLHPNYNGLHSNNMFTIKTVIQYSWLSTVFLCAFTYLLFALYIPQRLYYVCCKVQPRIRGYRGLIEDDY